MADREQSEFNMAVSYLNRLNALFYVCNESSISLDSYTWYHTLLTIFRELSTEMKDKEIEEFNQSFAVMQKLVAQTVDRNQRQGTNQIPGQLYDMLHNQEIKLRKILKSAGLQTRMVDDATKALR